MVRQSKPDGKRKGKKKNSFASDKNIKSIKREVAFVLESLLAGKSASTIISELDNDKEKAAAYILLLIHYRLIEQSPVTTSTADGELGDGAWVVTNAGKAWLQGLSRHDI